MRISGKLLILFMGISIVPMLVLRWNGHNIIHALGDDLAVKARKALVHQATGTLKHLVENHASQLQLKSDLVMMALRIQAAEIQCRLYGPETQYTASVFEPMAKAPLNDLYPVVCRAPGREGCPPVQVSHSRQALIIPTAMATREAVRIKDRLSSMPTVYRALKQGHHVSFLWQITALKNGVQTIYPAVTGTVLDLAGQTQWYRGGRAGEELVWGMPGPDPLTGVMASLVSVPLHGPDGRFAGITAIMVPLHLVLKENEEIRMLSNRLTSLIVRPDRKADSATGIRIIANEAAQKDHRYGWNFIPEVQWLVSRDREPLEQMATDMMAGRSVVRKIFYDHEECLVAYAPIRSNGTSFMMIVPSVDLIFEAAVRERSIQQRFKEELRSTTLIFLGVILGVILLSLLLSRYLTRNIKRLASASERLASGDFTARVDIRTRDEFGTLGQEFNRMVPALEERFRMKQGLEIARSVQQSFLPRTPPDSGDLEIGAATIYCDETGGDFYDFIHLDHDGRKSLGIAVGDVSGHGVSAALLMATARAFLRGRANCSLENISQMITRINTLVCQDTEVTCQFMTLFYVEIMLDTQTVAWVRAGHDPALVYDLQGDRFTTLMGRGIALGVDSGCSYPQNRLAKLDSGQILIIGTDGIWEARNPNGEMFGKDRLKHLIRQWAQCPAQEMVARITDSVRQFQENLFQDDDITLVIVKAK